MADKEQALTVRLPVDVTERLKQMARAHNRSVNKEIESVVRAALGNWEDDEYRKELQRRADERQARQ